jgi:hypothetical protein
MLLLATALAQASDPVAVYALVDKVTLEPNAAQPARIQVWGVFAIAKPNDRNFYQAPARGYLYFTLPPNDPDLARREWADIQSVAGKREVIAFGNRFATNARLRKKPDTPQSPDIYVGGMGLTKLRRETTYPPIRSLLDFKD